MRYIKQHRKVPYFNLLTSSKLNGYLSDIDKQAEEMFSQLVKQMAEREGVTEQLFLDFVHQETGHLNIAVTFFGLRICNNILAANSLIGFIDTNYTFFKIEICRC